MVSLYKLRRERRNRNKKTAKNKSRAFARKLKRKVKTCELCGSTGYLEVHHRDKNALNNKMSNLVSLCLPCHIEQHEHEPVAHLMRGKKPKKQKEVDWGPVVKFIKRLLKWK